MTQTLSQNLSYEARAESCSNATACKLFQLMARKRTNLCASVDVESSSELLEITDQIGTEICLLKFHVEILQDFDWNFIECLEELAARDDFLIVSDSKIGDIGNTAKRLYTKGLYRMAEWAHLVTAHPVPGPGVIQALEEGAETRERGILLVAQMSSKGALAVDDYTRAAVAMAEAHASSVTGFVCQERLTDDPRFIHFTPGVSLEGSGDGLGQQFRHPRHLSRSFSDVIAVGRGIYKATNPREAAELYKSEAWAGYEERRSNH